MGIRSTTKQDLIEEAAAQSGRTQIECRAAIEEFMELVKERLEAGDSIEIRGFGSFYSKLRQSRPARNPHTGVMVPLPRRRVPLMRFCVQIKLMITQTLKGGSR